MAYAGVLATVQLYQLEKANLTSEISDILMDITRASGKTSQISRDKVNAEKALKAEYSQYPEGYGTDSTEYQNELEMIQDDYDAQLEEINEWEKQLEVRKQSLETTLTATSSYLESFNNVLKDNVKKDSTYGGGSS